MPSDQQRDLTPILPKKERKTFFLLLCFLLLLALSLSSGLSYIALQGIASSSILRNENIYTIFTILTSTSLLLSIFGIYKKNYRMLASLGCIMLIAAQLIFIFGELTLEALVIGILTLLCAFPLLIPAINARISQLGSPKTAHRRLGFAYAFFPLIFFAYAPFADNLFSKPISAALILLTLLLWISSMRKKIWQHSSTEEQSKGKSCCSASCNIARFLCHMIILITLWQSILFTNSYTDTCYFFAALCFGAFFASYWSKNLRISQILHRVGLLFISINIILLSGLFAEITLPEDIMTALLLISAAFTPLCLTSYRRALLNSPSPENKGWTHLLLLLNFPASIAVLYLMISSF